MPREATSRDWLALLVLTVLWGSAFMFNELALAAFPPAVLVAGRIVIATAVIWGYLRLSGDTLPAPGRSWLPMVVLAIFGNVLPFHLVAWAQQHIDSSMAGILMAVMPLFVLTLAHFFIPGGRLTPWRAVGFVIGFSGVIIVIGPDAVRGMEDSAAFWGALAALGAALSYSVNTIYARRLGPGDPLRRSAGMLIIASMLSMPAAFVELPDTLVPGTLAVVSLGILGLLATGFATILYFRLIQGPGPAFLSLVNYLVPAWAVVAGTMLLGESVSNSVMIGLALILAGIAFSEFGSRVGPLLHGIGQRLLPFAPRMPERVRVRTREGTGRRSSLRADRRIRARRS
ncbi:MAG: DMT family transporter [Woeseiaceae bacterium]|nr:DMT family transporter [Woeseiaceae bacterium]